ncbi:MAG TPA: DUF4442 domain-containing protein [Chitinophagales bacterium]|nr:DUF4442 domain-containing protein [Chitinophagales bacterium]
MANTEKLEQYRQWRKESDPKVLKMLNSPFLFKIFLLGRLPMGFLAGLSVRTMNHTQCQIDVPYKWLNQNPFSSTYFAVLSMAAEMSTGMPAMMMTNGSKPSVSMLVTKLEAEFIKKATGVTTFTCNECAAFNEVVERAITTGEPQTYTATTVGTSKTGEVEARFKIEWSFKMRSK